MNKWALVRSPARTQAPSPAKSHGPKQRTQKWVPSPAPNHVSCPSSSGQTHKVQGNPHLLLHARLGVGKAQHRARRSGIQRLQFQRPQFRDRYGAGPQAHRAVPPQVRAGGSSPRNIRGLGPGWPVSPLRLLRRLHKQKIQWKHVGDPRR